MPTFQMGQLGSKTENMQIEEECHPGSHFLLSLWKRAFVGGSGRWKRSLGFAGHGCLLTAASEPTCPGTCATNRGVKKLRHPERGALELGL